MPRVCSTKFAVAETGPSRHGCAAEWRRNQDQLAQVQEFAHGRREGTPKDWILPTGSCQCKTFRKYQVGRDNRSGMVGAATDPQLYAASGCLVSLVRSLFGP